jgi:hypothetical protein
MIMSETSIDRQKRRLLKLSVLGVAAVPLGALVVQGRARAGEEQRLSEDDPTAKALSYVHDASNAPAGKRKEGTLCKNCNLIQTQEGEWRPCSIFPGKMVNENGWCAAWVGRL